MNSTDAKYQIDNPHENQKFSGEIIRLKDVSRGTTKTDCIEDFLSHVKESQESNIRLFASPTMVKAYSGEIDRYTVPFAVLELEMHPRLKLLKTLASCWSSRRA